MTFNERKNFSKFPTEDTNEGDRFLPSHVFVDGGELIMIIGLESDKVGICKRYSNTQVSVD